MIFIMHDFDLINQCFHFLFFLFDDLQVLHLFLLELLNRQFVAIFQSYHMQLYILQLFRQFNIFLLLVLDLQSQLLYCLFQFRTQLSNFRLSLTQSLFIFLFTLFCYFSLITQQLLPLLLFLLQSLQPRIEVLYYHRICAIFMLSIVLSQFFGLLAQHLIFCVQFFEFVAVINFDYFLHPLFLLQFILQIRMLGVDIFDDFAVVVNYSQALLVTQVQILHLETFVFQLQHRVFIDLLQFIHLYLSIQTIFLDDILLSLVFLSVSNVDFLGFMPGFDLN